ncbi:MULTISPECIES: terminase small subunit [Comamonas]|uniref:terminase small subunit n=1 Tax=Comamonas TaxID=283 RepID=UPI0001DA645F|nr:MULTISPECIES: terminase small subunit [Comamonas]EFI58741.1 bacteriophage terminase small subunit [Comamonas thiooxydans]TFF62564.1 terminase small subunit [Comamonas sp. A23]
MALTPKQERFVAEYLIDLNATQAAIRAGYSQKTAGQIGEQNLKKLEIAEAIKAAMEKRADRNSVTQDEVISGLRELRDMAMGKKPMRVTEILRVSGKPPKTIELDVKVFEAAAAKGALELLGKHIGMFKEKVELTGANGGPVETVSRVTRTIVDPKA